METLRTSPLSERDVGDALAYLYANYRASDEAGAEKGLLTYPQLLAFARATRRTVAEFSDALVNKMFFSCTPRHAMTAEEVHMATQHDEYGHDWVSLLVRALRMAAADAKAAHGSSPRRAQQGSTLTPSRLRSMHETRQREVETVLLRGKEFEAHMQSTLGQRGVSSSVGTATASSPPDDVVPWSVHADGIKDPFDKLRVNCNGVSLENARELHAARRHKELRKIRPNENGAIVVYKSPRNGGQSVVVVDATAEKARMQKALDRQAELKSMLAQGGSFVERYLNNELTLGSSSASTSAAHPNDREYQVTMAAIVDFLNSPRKKS